MRATMKSGGKRSKKVKVWVRVRPSQNFADEVIRLDPEGRSLQICMPRAGDQQQQQQQQQQRGFASNQRFEWLFRTDGIFHNASQQEVYETLGADLIEGGLAGYNGTIMCYGQTGAGKTFTITGVTEIFHHRGLVPRALSHLYKEIGNKTDLAITVRITYLEIYNDTMLDLLGTMPDSQEATSPLVIAEENGGVYVKGLNVHLAQTEEEALNLLFEGETNRATAAHALNKNSSRSHTIFTIYLETRSRFQSNSKYTTSKINFVDLAGSERLQKTMSTGKTQQEASYINKSLSFLEQTVIALTEKNREHVPYRQSKLTHYLKDSIGGGCKTILIANIWGDVRQLDETVSTMRFAQRMSCVASEPVENQRTDPSIMVKVLEAEIVALKKELAMHNTLHNKSHIHYEPISEQQRFELRQQVQRYIDGDLDEIDLTSIRQIQAVFELFRELCIASREEADTRFQELMAGQGTAATPPEGVARSLGPSTSGAQLGDAVGDLDGRSFGIAARSEVGMDESSVFLQSKRREAAAAAAATSKKSRQHPLGAAGGASSSGAGAAAAAESDGTPDVAGGGSETVGGGRPATPPSRTQAFEEFKRELGSEIYRILNENRTTMVEKKKEYSAVASQVNTLKTEIDRSRLRLDALKMEREAQGNLYTDEGELIINEEEFAEIKKLRQLKDAYKTDFERHKELKTQILYCQRMVDLTRQKLIQEFDKWYAESFLDSSAGGADRRQAGTSLEAGLGVRPEVLPPKPYEDPLDRFDRVKHQQLEHTVDLEAYNRAKESTVYRHVFTKAGRQGQPERRKPGTPLVNQRNQPPSRLEIM